MAANMAAKRSGYLWRLVGWSAALLVLLLPFAAMQFSPGVNWSPGDFMLMAVLLGGAGLGLELAFRKTLSGAYRTGAACALAAGFLTVVVNGAVGIIGSEQEAANLLYLGAPLIALAGAAVARLRAAGMAAAAGAAAVATALVPVVASSVGPVPSVPVWSAEIVGATAVLAALWLLAAWLFRRAAA
jgi:hypothetical protein